MSRYTPVTSKETMAPDQQHVFDQVMGVFGQFEFQLNRAAGALSIWQDSTIEGKDGTLLYRELKFGPLSEDAYKALAAEVAKAKA